MIKTKNGIELTMLDLKGKQYLPVAQRILWMRDEHPLWSITTEIVSVTAEYALVKATVTAAATESRVSIVVATAHQDCYAKEFPDHVAKAETSAIGRALAIAGYGTQFAQELEEGERISDAPQDEKKKSPVKPIDSTSMTLPKPVIPKQETQPEPSKPLASPRIFETYEDAFKWLVPFPGDLKGKALGEITDAQREKIKFWIVMSPTKTAGMLDFLEACVMVENYNKK